MAGEYSAPGGSNSNTARNAADARNDLPLPGRGRLAGLGLLRSLATAGVLVTVYYLLPLNHITNVRLMLVAGLALLLAVSSWELRAVTRARYPAVRAIEALATTVPWFVLLFASAYFIMARTNPASFNTHPLTRTDALYFTVTVFATVGFGDIAAVSQSARLVVTAQMMLDLLVLGLGVRVFVGTVQFARRQADPGSPPGQALQQADDT